MSSSVENEHNSLTFSQREHKAPFPHAMELQQLPKRFKQLVWRSIDTEIEQLISSIFMLDMPPYYPSGRDIPGLPEIIWAYKFDIELLPHDEIPYPNPIKDKEFCRELILTKDYHEVLTFVEYILRNESCPDNLSRSLMASFQHSPVAYLAENIDGIPTIIPRVSLDSGRATRQALDVIQEYGMGGGTAHLRRAAEHLNAQRYADSIGHSIRAVESVARRIDPGASNDLRLALRSLESANVLKHPALREAFVKLYAYTSDEEGIRHAQVFKEQIEVGPEDALFFFGACAAFAAYLAQKHRQVESR